MAKKPYFPNTDAAFGPWISKFETGVAVAANATALGWTSAEATAAINAAKAIRLAIADVAAKEAALKAAVTAKNLQIISSAGVIRPLVKRGKLALTYTETVGYNVGIVGDDADPIDWANFQPVIKAITRPGLVEISFEKKKADGVNIYTRLKGQANWVKLAFDQYSPYIDNRPSATPGQPENREYCAIAVVNDMEVSQRSDIISVAFAG